MDRGIDASISTTFPKHPEMWMAQNWWDTYLICLWWGLQKYSMNLTHPQIMLSSTCFDKPKPYNPYIYTYPYHIVGEISDTFDSSSLFWSLQVVVESPHLWIEPSHLWRISELFLLKSLYLWFQFPFVWLLTSLHVYGFNSHTSGLSPALVLNLFWPNSSFYVSLQALLGIDQNSLYHGFREQTASNTGYTAYFGEGDSMEFGPYAATGSFIPQIVTSESPWLSPWFVAYPSWNWVIYLEVHFHL